MAPSFRWSTWLLSLPLLTLLVSAATVTYDFNVSWVDADPTGDSDRKVMGINGQWPIPTIDVNKGDRLIVNLYNGLPDVSTSLHFHGLYQNGTTHMDGAAQVSQCGVVPGGSFTYNFTVDQPGTYWYHSHIKGQYPDGLRGPFIVRDTTNPFKSQYDEEIVMTLSDWYNDFPSALLSSFISYANPTGAEPVPNAALMNDTQDLKVAVQPGKTYMFRMVNMAAFAAQYVWFEGHNMTIVEVDGVYTQPTEAEMIYVTAAQRYSVLVTMKNDTGANFAINGAMDTDLFDAVPEGLNTNVTGWLVYDAAKSMPEPALLDAFDPFDDFTLVPYDNQTLLDKVDYSMTLTMKMDTLGDGANYAFFNDVTYVAPKVPTLYTAMTTGQTALNPQVYGDNTNAFVLNKGDVVEIVLNNEDTGKHPFHIHGHAVQVVQRADEDSGDYDPTANNTFPDMPMRRDTVWVKPTSNMVLRFVADNPGVWLFHCHIEWHTASGLIATLVEAPTELQKSLTIPQSHYDTCKAANIPTTGNAAGNTVNLLDLSGENRSPDPLPEGFTARGIVALVFSCLSAFLGMGVIGWYGSQPVTGAAARKVKSALVANEVSEPAVGTEKHGQPMMTSMD